MLIFWCRRLVFLATPKAGSTAVEVALESLAEVAVQRPPEMKHVNAEGFQRFVRPWLAALTVDRFTTIALMREPVDWVRSWYRFRLRDDQEDPAHPMAGVDFDRFARSYIDDPLRATDGFGTQSAFLGPAGGVDRLFRYEDMEKFTHFLDEWLDCDINLPRVNVPPAADVSLRPETEAALRDALAEDLALYASLDRSG